MGSRRLITVLLVCLFIYDDIKNTQANVGNHREERHEYQYQRSSKVVGGSGYETAPNLDGWTQSQRDQVQGMADKLRTELSTAEPGQYYQSGGSYSGTSVNGGQGCTTICALIPGFAGRTQEEIDSIAKDMTSQIIADLQSGKLDRSQMNQPNWFEQQVAQKVIELRKHHQEQYEQNVYRATNRFRENQGTQVHPSYYAGGRTYSKDTEDVQQQQENVFSDADLRQVQQSVFDQRQHQQQGNFYQQQSQNQQHTVYTRPSVHRYYNSQTTSRDTTNEDRIRTVYPTPIVVTNNVKEEKNFTSTSSTASVPQINVYNQYGRTDKDFEDTQYTQTMPLPTVIPNYDRSYYAQKEYEDRQRNVYRPVTYPSTSQTIQTSQTTSQRERTIPVVIPTQRTITTNTHVDERNITEVRRPQPTRVYNNVREEKTEERETYHRNRQNVVPPTRQTSYVVHEIDNEEKSVQVQTPSPVPVTTNKHSIYNHVVESDVVPNYQPRVVIDKNTEFEVLDHRRESNHRIPQVPITHTQTTIDESDEIHTHQQPHRPYPYPVYTNRNETIEQNQSNISTFPRRPTYSFYPSFRSNTTVLDNGDSYISTVSNIPVTYTIELTVEEYEERLHRLRNELVRLGYDRLTDEEYNSTIATGGFLHNGYKYLYNANTGRYEKTSVVEVNTEEYEVIYQTLQQKLQEIGLSKMCEQEEKQTINTGVFIRNGNKFVYNSERETYDRFQINEEERRQIFTRIQEELRRLRLRLLTRKENEGFLINGHFIRAAYQWIYNILDGTIEKTIYVGDFAEFTDDEYREIYQKIQDTLRRIGYTQMSGSQCNETIVSGTFERGGIYWSYNPNSGEFERIHLSQEDYQDRVQILRNELIRLGHRQLSAEELREIIYRGYFYHGSYRYEYVKDMRRYEQIDLSRDEDYQDRVQILRNELIRLGHRQLSAEELREIIDQGYFYHGAYRYEYVKEMRRYKQVDLSSDEDYQDRVRILTNELKRLGHRELSAEEIREIIIQGYFYHGAYRYDYVKEMRRYKQINLSRDEYNERLRQLKEQLITIGYGTMSEAECNSTITSGKFYYLGYEWVYSYVTRDYQKGNKISTDEYSERLRQLKEQLIRIGYGTMSEAECNSTITSGKFYYLGHEWVYSYVTRDYQKGIEMIKPPVANRTVNGCGPYQNRGDQQPQHCDDYEEYEILEEEPGMGYYPIGKKPEIGLATPETFDRISETTPLPTETQYVVPSDYQRERQRHEQQLTTQIWPTQPETISERRYHRKQTTYSQTSAILPQQFATQRSMRHVPANEIGDDQEEQDETSTPFEPLAVSTQAYLVGNERPSYNLNDQSGIIEQYLRNKNQHPATAVDVSDNYDNYQQQQDLKSENIEDLGQQFEDFDGQHEEDVQQQIVDLNAEAEDLRQQQVDITRDDRNGHQKLLDNSARESNQRPYNSHYHGGKETVNEYEAEVVQVTDKAEQQSEESPGMWTRFKDKTIEFFG